MPSQVEGEYFPRPLPHIPYIPDIPAGQVRKFDTGATRDGDKGKLDPEGALSPQVLLAFCKYMDSHRQQPDGTYRDADNWQKGFPDDCLMKSLLRHVMDIWMLHRGVEPVRPETDKEVTWDDALGGALFNIQALWLKRIEEHG